MIARLLARLVPLRPFGLFLERAYWLDPPEHPNCLSTLAPIGERL